MMPPTPLALTDEGSSKGSNRLMQCKLTTKERTAVGHFDRDSRRGKSLNVRSDPNSYCRVLCAGPCSEGRVEDGRGSLGHAATLRFPSPLIEPDVRISGIRLSDWLHREAHETKH